MEVNFFDKNVKVQTYKKEFESFLTAGFSFLEQSTSVILGF